MIEGDQAIEIPIADKSDAEPDEEFDPLKAAWKELYMAMAKVSERRPEDSDEIAFEGDIEDLQSDRPYLLRIHAPFLDIDGLPKAIMLDIYKDGVHTQRAMALAQWTDGIPEVTDLNNDQIEFDSGYFDLKSLAGHAMILITTAVADSGAIFPLPQEYGTKIH